ncbi:TonB-dependent siderophore receptor [Brucella gallinifaecis]|uniref:TonB-dependent siderophore receptor n=1 Tax=Brucella gallinifaecis TaxID=215590 RepID=UPI00235DD255|nr:TonB-dependent siderophore receptor [Brucella gallinifaecis]
MGSSLNLEGIKVKILARNRHALLVVVLSGTTFASIVAAHAQEAASHTVLAPIVVNSGSEDPTAPIKGYVAKTSISATKTGTPLVETPQSISVVTANEMAAQGAQTLGQALGYTPGVVSEPYGSDPRFDSPLIRGFDGRQVQFLNGLRLMRTAGASAVDPYMLERIEVVRGPASVMFGQGNPGGLINMISKRPTFEKFGEIGVQAGSYETYGTYFDFGGPVAESDQFAYRLTGMVRKAGTQTDFLDNDRYFIAPAFTWKPDEDTKLTILTSFQHDNPSSPSGLPPEFTLNSTGYTLPRDFSLGDPDFDRSSRDVINLGYELEHRINDTWTFRQNARYSNQSWQYQALGYSNSGRITDGRTLRRIATFQDERLNTYNIDNNLVAEFNTGPVEHKFLAGLDYRYFDNNVETQFWRWAPLDIFNPIYGQPINLTERNLATRVDSSLTQLGIYAQDELAYENWRATFGLRQDWASTKGTSSNLNSGITRPLDKDDHKLTGRAGLGYVFDNGIAPYISYSTSFEPLAVPATGPVLEPTTGKQWEAGIKYQPNGWDGYFTAAIYDLRQQNVAVSVLENDKTVTKQIGEVRVRGLELEGVASLAQGFDLRAAYTYMDAENIEGNYNGKRPANVPKHAASLWLDYTFQEGSALEGFGIGGGVRYVGQRYGDLDNNYNLDAITLTDAAIHYQKDHIRASLNIKNIADKKYVASCSSFGCNYGDGRTYLSKLTFTW